MCGVVVLIAQSLIAREFNDAIKVGNSKILLVLKTCGSQLPRKRLGNGRTKYAYEMLHLIHNDSEQSDGDGAEERDIVWAVEGQQE
jgi:hypothetical protein